MNTKFNILWFEDTDEWYNIVKEQIQNYIEDLCFEPEFFRYKTINKEISDSLPDKNFDLIFADLNLREKTTGDEAIRLIRDKNILADVLFYSTDGIDKIKSVMKSEVLEGVYLSDRNEILFPVKANQLIDKIVMRSEDVLNVRGMLMDNVSEFDEKLKDVIRKFFSIASEDEIAELNQYAHDQVCEQIRTNQCKVDGFKENFILESMNSSFILDSYKLSLIVNKIFKTKYSDYAKMSNFHESYNSLILSERNKLAHAKKEPEASGNFYFQDSKGNKTVYDSVKCRKIRNDINNYNQLLTEIIDVIK